MAAFAQFGSDLDASTQQLLARGVRLTEMLKQDVNATLVMEEQCVVLFAGVKGYLDRIDVASIRAFETAWLAHIKGSHAAIITSINSDRAISDTTDARLHELCDAFSANFSG